MIGTAIKIRSKASEISNLPAQSLTSTNVQAALNELDAEVQGKLRITSLGEITSIISSIGQTEADYNTNGWDNLYSIGFVNAINGIRIIGSIGTIGSLGSIVNVGSIIDIGQSEVSYDASGWNGDYGVGFVNTIRRIIDIGTQTRTEFQNNGWNSEYAIKWVTAIDEIGIIGSIDSLGDVTFAGTVNGLTKAMVGLGNVDNTADANKPVSTATQTALDAKGTVTSVGLSVSGVLHTVSDSPVTGTGTLTMTLNTQIANTIFAGPTSGAAATPTMRAMVPADMPVATTSAAGSLSATDKLKINRRWTTEYSASNGYI